VTAAVFYGVVGGGIVLSAALILYAVDLVTRGPERRAIARRRKAVRNGVRVKVEGPYR
jgi:hypothetical protein